MLTTLALIAIVVIGYAYVGYPCVLLFLQQRRAAPVVGCHTPTITVLIAAHNEESEIAEVLTSLQRSQYPPDKLQIMVVSDGSTDRTDQIVTTLAAGVEAPQITLIKSAVRGGKVAALCQGLPLLTSEVVVLADASGVFLPGTLQALADHFLDQSVGACVGRKQTRAGKSVVAVGDGLYATYDLWLRRLESGTGGSLVGCEGGITAIRRQLLIFHSDRAAAEDYLLGCHVYECGYRTVVEPVAVVLEPASAEIGVEFARKVRVIVRGIRGLMFARRFLVPWRHPMFFFQNVSHRLLRWCVPFALLVLLASSLVLGGMWTILAVAQLVVYGTALIEWRFSHRAKSPTLSQKLRRTILYFVSMNLAALVAWTQLFRKYETWDRTAREMPGEEAI